MQSKCKQFSSKIVYIFILPLMLRDCISPPFRGITLHRIANTLCDCRSTDVNEQQAAVKDRHGWGSFLLFFPNSILKFGHRGSLATKKKNVPPLGRKSSAQFGQIIVELRMSVKNRGQGRHIAIFQNTIAGKK